MHLRVCILTRQVTFAGVLDGQLDLAWAQVYVSASRRQFLGPSFPDTISVSHFDGLRAQFLNHLRCRCGCLLGSQNWLAELVKFGLDLCDVTSGLIKSHLIDLQR